MAEVRLSRDEAQGDRFPPICMQCGAPSTEAIDKKYSTDQVAHPIPPPEPLGCFVLWPILLLLKLFSWSIAKEMTVRTPLCRKHARGWFTWSTLDAKSITEDAIVLAGVSDQFAQAWERQRETERPRESGSVKVRCRSCRALNDEGAKFCDQCGAKI